MFEQFRGLPGNSSKEIFLITANLATVVSGNVLTTFELLKMREIRCSVIGLSAEMFVCKKLCSTTSGKYCAVLDENHFEMLLSDHVHPPVAAREQEASIVRMGFPQRCAIRVPSFSARCRAAMGHYLIVKAIYVPCTVRNALLDTVRLQLNAGFVVSYN